MKEFPVIELESMSLEQFQTLEKQMIAEGIALESAQHSLTTIGGVSRAYAEGFQEYLPEGIALESFSNNVTKEHHGIALESLTAAIALVAGVGLIAVLGGVYILMKKLGERSLKKPQVKQINQVNKAYGEMDQLVSKYRQEYTSIAGDNDQALGQKAIHEISEEIAVHKHLLALLAGTDVKIIHVRILTGKYNALSIAIGMKIGREIDELIKYLNDHVLALLDKAVSRGEACTLEEIADISGKARSTPPFGLVDEIHKWGVANKLQGHGLDVFREFRSDYFKQVETIDADAAVTLHGVVNIDVPNEQIIKAFEVSQERVTATVAKIDKISKRATGNRQIPTDVVNFIRRNLEECREAVLAYNDVYSTVKRENEAITFSAQLKGQAFSLTVKDLRDRVANVENAEHRKHLTEALTALAGHYTKH